MATAKVPMNFVTVIMMLTLTLLMCFLRIQAFPAKSVFPTNDEDSTGLPTGLAALATYTDRPQTELPVQPPAINEPVENIVVLLNNDQTEEEAERLVTFITDAEKFLAATDNQEEEEEVHSNPKENCTGTHTIEIPAGEGKVETAIGTTKEPEIFGTSAATLIEEVRPSMKEVEEETEAEGDDVQDQADDVKYYKVPSVPKDDVLVPGPSPTPTQTVLTVSEPHATEDSPTPNSSQEQRTHRITESSEIIENYTDDSLTSISPSSAEAEEEADHAQALSDETTDHVPDVPSEDEESEETDTSSTNTNISASDDDNDELPKLHEHHQTHHTIPDNDEDLQNLEPVLSIEQFTEPTAKVKARPAAVPTTVEEEEEVSEERDTETVNSDLDLMEPVDTAVDNTLEQLGTEGDDNDNAAEEEDVYEEADDAEPEEDEQKLRADGIRQLIKRLERNRRHAPAARENGGSGLAELPVVDSNSVDGNVNGNDNDNGNPNRNGNGNQAASYGHGYIVAAGDHYVQSKCTHSNNLGGSVPPVNVKCYHHRRNLPDSPAYEGTGTTGIKKMAKLEVRVRVRGGGHGHGAQNGQQAAGVAV